jgi:protein-tyrosine phosphatase
MIDIHCHILPGVDDGAQTMSEALNLAQAAVDDGISCVMLTPHMHKGRYESSFVSLLPLVETFRVEITRHEIPLRLGLAAEIRIGFELLDWLQEGKIPFLGRHEGREVMLLEFPNEQVPPGADKLMKRMIDEGVQPLIAHPERNEHVIRKLDVIKPFVDMGCLLQVTAGSVAGTFGPLVRDRAHEMLERAWVHVLASDAHDTRWRPPNLSLGRQAAAKLVGERESWALVKDRPWQLTRNHFV